MATLTIKNLPDDLYQQLKRRARAQRRSINSEAIVCLENSLTVRHVEPESYVASIRGVREKTAAYRIREDDLRNAKNAGRP